MKTIAYQDVAGGSIHLYENKSKPNQTRWERYNEALEDLKPMARIKIYRFERGKLKLLKIKSW